MPSAAADPCAEALRCSCSPSEAPARDCPQVSPDPCGDPGGTCRCACGSCHADRIPAAPDPALSAQASATRAVYRIPAMDCPMEEALIRKKLAELSGIRALSFNLLQRVLTVDHSLPSPEPIEAALRAIDMIPEPLLPESVQAVFSLPGMDSPAQETLVRGALAGVPGVLSLETDLDLRTVRIRHVPGALPAAASALSAFGLGAALSDADSGRPELPRAPVPWRRLSLAGLCAAFSEGFELARDWGWQPFGLDFSSEVLAGMSLAAFLALALALAAIGLSGLTTFRKGWLALTSRSLNMNALMSVAVTGAVLIGQFPEAAMVMVLFNVSEAIEARALDRARRAISGLLALAPDKACVRQPDGGWLSQDVRAVAPGSLVRVRPGEKIALDGVVRSGSSAVNQAPITGESLPVEKGPGDPVYAGTVNESGSFEFEVTAAATDSTLARIIHAVEEAQSTRAPIQRFVDAFAAWYTPAVFLTALLTALLPPLFLGWPWLEAVPTALIVLVIGCPCALVIATPVTIVSGMAAATRSGILIKGGLYLEQGRLLNCLAMDKTGTLTQGRPSLTDLVPTAGLDGAGALRIAASLACRSDHPVSKAIAQAARKAGMDLLPVTDFEALPGLGIRGRVDGTLWHLGNLRLAESLGPCPADLKDRLARLECQGKSAVCLVSPEGVQALLAAADRLRATSLEAIRDLKGLGVRTVMLTGDNENAARRTALEAGVDECRAELLPQDKQAVIEELTAAGERVGMAGDGINDAPALARAHVGFAMASAGTDTAIETADVALMDDDLRKIPRFIRLSRATHAILVQNITLALAIKALFFALTFAGHATMWMAVFADVGTALLVVANGLRAASR